MTDGLTASRPRSKKLLSDAVRLYDERLLFLNAFTRLANKQVAELLCDSALDWWRSAVALGEFGSLTDELERMRLLFPSSVSDCSHLLCGPLPGIQATVWADVAEPTASDALNIHVLSWLEIVNLSADWMFLAAHHSVGLAVIRRAKGINNERRLQMSLSASPESLVFGGRPDPKPWLEDECALAALLVWPIIEQWAERSLSACEPRLQSEDEWVEFQLSKLRPALKWFYQAVKGTDDTRYRGNPDRRVSARGMKSFDWLVRYQVLGHEVKAIAEDIIAGTETDEVLADPDYDREEKIVNKVKEVRTGIRATASRIELPLLR